MVEAGCDLVFVETVIDVQDAAIAATALRSCSVPVWLSATFNATGALLGEGDAAQLPRGEVDALIVGCTEGQGLAPALAHLPDAGWRGVAPSTARTIQGTLHPDHADPARLRDHVTRVCETAHLQIVGGCCGTTPGWIGSLAAHVHPTAKTRSRAFDDLHHHIRGLD